MEAFEKLLDEKKGRIIEAGIRVFSQSAYRDARTDDIVASCGISKGLLFHYFGSKKAFYLYCLEKSMERLTAKENETLGEDFHEILFSAMDQKMHQCIRWKEEMHMVNMASRDASGEIAKEKAEVLASYRNLIQNESARILSRALETLEVRKSNNKQLTVQGLHIYINALLNQYLLRYQQTPDLFFENREQIKEEMKALLNLMLYGICD